MQDTLNPPSIYQDKEVIPAVQELFSYPELYEGMRAFLPETLVRQLSEEKDSVRSVHDFQTNIILPVLRLIEAASISKRSFSGLENLDKNERYLFISNHRDIVLDSAFINTVLHDNGFETSQIAIGDNLMKHRISELIFRINKSFVVKRSGTPIELYRYSVLLSEYIRDTVTQKKDSVWIAQREGRAKDGNDRTQTGLLKMLSLCSEGDLKSFFRSLKIVPVAISYEYDPCAVLKTREFLLKQRDPSYKKTFAEDVEHMLLGLQGPKGEAHFHFGEVMDEALEAFDAAPNAKKQLECLAALIDNSIHRNYMLHAVNYWAYDYLNEGGRFADRYSDEEKQGFVALFDQYFAQTGEDPTGEGKQYLLGIYANPVANWIKATSPEQPAE